MTAPADSWLLRTSDLDTKRGIIVGILNVTPDSFSDGGEYLEPDAGTEHGLEMWSTGADLIDVGGQSTQPGSVPVTVDEELRRVAPVVEALVSNGARVAVDTSKPEVAKVCLGAGAEVINDVTALGSEGMANLVAESGSGVVLMHMKGSPADMQNDPRYDDVVREVETFLLERASFAEDSGIDRRRICIDPGIGFGKTVEHNLQLLRAVPRLASHGYPLMLGASRKRFLGRLLAEDVPRERDDATAVTTALGFADGARVFRVHNVVASRRALAVVAAIVAPLQWDEWLLDSSRGGSPG